MNILIPEYKQNLGGYRVSERGAPTRETRTKMFGPAAKLKPPYFATFPPVQMCVCLQTTTRVRLGIAKDIALGMKSLYDHGMQHRHLTSNSVLLTGDYRAKVRRAVRIDCPQRRFCHTPSGPKVQQPWFCRVTVPF